MENAGVFLGLHDFLERMRQPSAADFVKSIKSFIVSFSNNAPDPERDSSEVQEFLRNMEAAFRAHPLWAGCSEDELDSAGEGLEKYVMTKLFTRVYASIPEDVKTDEQISDKIALVQQFVRPENLDIKPTFQNETSWLLAQKELQKINMCKAPRDKLVCILNCCKVINNLLLNASIASSENPPGADEFLPVLIYVTIKANPPQLHSNLLYIQRYRCQSRLVGEAAYFFTNMLSAESFISNIDARALSMEESEFERNMESARALLAGLSTDMDSPPSQSDQSEGKVSVEQPKEFNYQAIMSEKEKECSSLRKSAETKYEKTVTSATDQEPITKVPSLSELESKGAIMLLKEDKPREVFQAYPYLFAQVGDLTIKDVEDLLNNYKQLVFKYVCLSEGLDGATPSLPPPVVPTQVQQSAGIMKEPDHKTVNSKVESQRYTCATDDPPNHVLTSDEEKVETQLAEESTNTELIEKSDGTSQ